MAERRARHNIADEVTSQSHRVHIRGLSSPPCCNQAARLHRLSSWKRKEGTFMRNLVRHKARVALTIALVLIGVWVVAASHAEFAGRSSDFLRFSAPAGDRPATTDTVIDGVRAADSAERPIGHTGGHRGERSGAKAVRSGVVAGRRDAGDAQQRRRSVLVDADHATRAAATPTVKRIDVNASFMGVVFSPDSRRVYLSGGENGNIWIARRRRRAIIGSVNLNGPTHPARSPARCGDHAGSCISKGHSQATWL